MKDQQHRYCRNCHYPLSPQAKYCSQCSQKYTTGKITVASFLREFFEDHLNFDSKLFKTASTLLIPGKLTDEYFKGRHKRFASPLRLFLVSAILLITALSLSIPEDALSSDHILDLRNALNNKALLYTMDSLGGEIKTNLRHPRVDQALDSLRQQLLNHHEFEDTFRIDESLSIDGNSIWLPDIAVRDIFEKSPDEVVDLYSQNLTFWQKLFFTQTLKVFLSGDSLFRYMFDKVSLSVLFMMPFLAMVLTLLYFRKKRFYVEHLVFSFHYHSFLFLVLSIVIFSFRPPPPQIIIPIVLLLFVYLFLSMKKVYKQGFRKTFLKFMLLNFCYIFLVSIFAVLTILVSFALF